MMWGSSGNLRHRTLIHSQSVSPRNSRHPIRLASLCVKANTKTAIPSLSASSATIQGKGLTIGSSTHSFDDSFMVLILGVGLAPIDDQLGAVLPRATLLDASPLRPHPTIRVDLVAVVVAMPLPLVLAEQSA